MSKSISGFSKLSKRGKLRWLVENFFKDPENVMRELKSYWLSNEEEQKILDGFSENTISNFYLPFGVAPNFVINDKTYAIPMVIEESSVVAAASSGAKFWMTRGGFKAKVISTKKVGQVHFTWTGDANRLEEAFDDLKLKMHKDASEITKNMEARGGGVQDVQLINYTGIEKNYFQLMVNFETCDSMGANFINSVLESYAKSLSSFVAARADFIEKEVTIIMSILSNYTPECLVRAWVECPIEDLGTFSNGIDAAAFAKKFCTAIRIAHIDQYRATTHNKGIFNGIDAVVLATGNDFRAIEACGHTYASRDGHYRSLSHCKVKNGVFKFWIDLPLAIGTVGGLTKLHPIAKRSLEMLGNPSAEELMMIIAATGLSQNFAAIRSLVTTGIQQGHMKMHLVNMLNSMKATEEEKEITYAHFEERTVSHNAVRAFLDSHRVKKTSDSTLLKN